MTRSPPPAARSGSDPGILQMHSSDYRRPAQLQDGPALVVGASHSGADIAYEVGPTHDTVRSGHVEGEVPFRIESRTAHLITPVLFFVARHLLTIKTPLGRKMRPEIRMHGGPVLRVKQADLERVGAEWTPSGRRVDADPRRWGEGRPSRARRRPRPRRDERDLVHRVPPGLRLDQDPGARGGRLVPDRTRSTSPSTSLSTSLRVNAVASWSTRPGCTTHREVLPATPPRHVRPGSSAG